MGGAGELLGLTLLSLALTVTKAWFFKSDLPVVKATGPVDADCLAMGQAGSCEFYRCLEARLPCGTAGYARKFGTPYCARFQHNYDSFTPRGQRWVNATTACLTQALLPLYRGSEVDCHRLAHHAWDAVSACYVANGFCDVLKDNAQVLVDIYQPRHLFQTGALKIWKEILETTYKCDPERYHGYMRTAWGYLTRGMAYLAEMMQGQA